MGKRIFLFLITNLAIVVMLSVIMAFLGVGRYVGPDGIDTGALAVFALVWGMGGAFLSLQMSRFIAKKATGVRLVDGRTGQDELDWLYSTVARLTQQASLPMPEVGLYESPEVNAFATGPSKRRSLVAVSSGLLRSMRRDEVEGVLAHEVAHIGNGDMVTMTLLQGVINAFVIFFARLIAFAMRSSDSRSSYGSSYLVIIVLEIVLGIFGSLITAWFSRHREFRADRGGAALAGRERMLGALRRLAANRELVETQHQALATLKINGTRGWMVFFSTHPPLEARIAALERFQQ
ncbi:MAG: zinc metalloprotease HtpX [Acidobacteria bacterium RIFCSPLOWO2_12_FULL_67_14]|nr:MAG: zinc metalloprotease HtpX [Acidobacteria bacterium RIFCSPLOWO2_02_FULL_67_21]OFW39329.1 MAG: zinc metalloprotease HtpX [Acidobacteria bacterium RIFCSPLOWO2_12_FULL_67_14]